VSGFGVRSEEFFGGFVTWSALEDALRGGPDSQPNTKPMPVVVEKTVLEASEQTDPVSRDRE